MNVSAIKIRKGYYLLLTSLVIYLLALHSNHQLMTMTTVRFLFLLLGFSISSLELTANGRPNILFCISDDQSYAHTGANGDPVVKTPAFDRIAKEGLRFTRAFCDAPTCGPSRSAILTGQGAILALLASSILSSLAP